MSTESTARQAGALDQGTPEPVPRLRAAVQRLTDSNTIWIFLVLVVLVAAYSIARPGQFATTFNLRSLCVDAATLLILAVGMTYVIITAGIDLSVGSVLVFAGVVSAKAMNAAGGVNGGWATLLLGLVVALAGGLGWGLLNGLLVGRARIPPLIVTLGSLGMALGAAQLLTGGVDVRNVPLKLSQSLGNGAVLGIPWLVVVALLAAVIGGLALTQTRFGRHTYAIGSNPEAARRVGISVTGHLIRVYALAGLLAGLAGFLNLARFSTTTIGGHTTDNLSVIAAVVLGGTSLFGGMGTVAGTVIGVFIPAVLSNGFVILGVQPFWQSVAVGAVLIAAVYFDMWRRRARLQR